VCLSFLINIREFQDSSAFEFQMAIMELKRQKSSGIDQIHAQMIISGVRSILPKITKLINSIWNREETLEEWKESIILP
jgi:hypothetical protein